MHGGSRTELSHFREVMSQKVNDPLHRRQAKQEIADGIAQRHV
jgi:hypothetical protein